MEVTRTPEELQSALTAEQEKNKQLELERNTERDARGKAEQALRDANQLIDELNQELGERPAAVKAHTATLGSGKDAQTYQFVVPQFYLAGHGKVVATDVKNNSDVLKALVKAGAKVIELVPAK